MPEPDTRRRILVVDDHKDVADSLAVLLDMLGYQTQAAWDGRSALEAAARFRPHVVLLDISLPDLDGYEVARRLRESGGKGPILVALTGYGQLDRRPQEADFAHHLLKPVDFETLRQLLGRL